MERLEKFGATDEKHDLEKGPHFLRGEELIEYGAKLVERNDLIEKITKLQMGLGSHAATIRSREKVKSIIIDGEEQTFVVGQEFPGVESEKATAEHMRDIFREIHELRNVLVGLESEAQEKSFLREGSRQQEVEEEAARFLAEL